MPVYGFRTFFWFLLVFWNFLPSVALARPSPYRFWTSSQGGDSDSLASSTSVASVVCPLASPFRRWGEALHPGPVDTMVGVVPFSFSNPSGLRNKEEIAVGSGHGVHSFVETQLSKQTQRSCGANLRFHAAQQHRDIKTLFGAPVAPRSNSEWAGGWSGVATITDASARELQLPYCGERECGRVLAAQHYFGDVRVQNVAIYGYPKGPTWPAAHDLTSKMLQVGAWLCWPSPDRWRL